MGFMDIVHGALDVAGFIPGVGAIADGINAGLYAAEGDWGNAALSLAAAVPGVGDAAAVVGKTAKIAGKAAKASKTAKAVKTAKAAKSSKALSKIKGMSSLIKKAAGKAKTGAKKIANKLSKEADFIKQKIKNKKKCKKAGSCFTGDTLVCVKGGCCLIKDIQAGDEIYSRNAQTGEIGFQKVCNVVQSAAHTIYHVWMDGKEELKVTAYHPFSVKDRGWVNAMNLRQGDLLETMNGTSRVAKVEKTRHEEPVEVYNFRVEGWESYFVSDKQVYVHNGNGACGSMKKRAPSKKIENGYDKIKRFREKAGIGPYADNSGNTVATVSVKGRDFFGVNSSITKESKIKTKPLREKWLKEIEWVPPKKKQPKHLGHAQSLTHAEAHALMRAYEKCGKLPEKITMYVDRKTCNICRGELPALLKKMGVKELEVFSGGSEKSVIIKAIR